MSNDILSKLETIKIYFTNDIQDITVCKDRETDKIYFLNNIHDKNIIKDVDFKKLLQNVKNIKNVIEIEDGVCIISEYFNYYSLDEYTKNNKLILSRSISYATFIIDILVKLKEFPTCILKSIFDCNNIIIDKNKNISMLGLIILSKDYAEVTMSQVFKNLADIFHIIFTGNEVLDSLIDKNIPPTIYNMITKCLKNEYLSYIALAKEFKDSKIYRLMNPEVEESQKIYSIRKGLKRKRKKRILARISLFVIIILMISLTFILKSTKVFRHKLDFIDSKLEDPIIEEKKHTENGIGEEVYASKDDDEDEKDQADKNIYESNEENLFKFYNADFLEKYKGEPNIGFLDEEKYHKGNSSVRIENLEDSKKTFLIGGIDLENIDFKYLTNRYVNLSMWTNAENDIDAMITVKTMQGDNILAKYSKKIYIPQNTWSLQNINLKSVNGDYLKIYLITNERESIWIDSFEIDVLK